jgi:DNA replication protein DnaC
MTSNQLLKDYLKRLKLPTIARVYERMAEEAGSRKAGYEEFLCSLLEQEVQARDEKLRKERITQAKFPVVKMMDTFDFAEIPTLDKRPVLKLFKGQYLEMGENIVFIGGQGTGKTHLAIALGVQACNDTKRVYFVTAADLIHQLLEARDDKQLLRYQQQLSRYDLLIVDELGRVECTPDGAALLAQVLSNRYERKASIITTNLEFGQWSSVFCTQQLTAAVLDRLMHHSHIIEVNGESYRFKHSLRRQKERKPTAAHV